MPREPACPSATPRPASPHLVATVVVLATLFGVAIQAPAGLVLWAWDGLLAGLMLVTAACNGRWLLHLLRMPSANRLERWLIATGLGVAWSVLVVLVLGMMGWTGAQGRWVAPAVLLVGGLAGVGALRREKHAAPAPTDQAKNPWPWLWLTVVPFAALIMIVALQPPGILWQEEGFGYDVLEYHLQTPKEYYLDGAITYLPHNVYANFPAAAEMLYLLALQVTGEPIEFWLTAKCLNAWLGFLFVGAAWWAGSARSARVGIVAGVLAASTGWLTYLSGLAYVENGLLFAGMLATGCALRARHDTLRWSLLCGVFAGLACAFKYTAGPMVALPLAVWLIAGSGGRSGLRWRAAACLVTGWLVTFGPWMVKNTAFTGNPAFPMMHGVFGGEAAGWGTVEASHFAASHRLDDDANIARRLAEAWRNSIADRDQRFGVLLLPAALAGLATGGRRWGLPLGLMLAWQLLFWLLGTHVYARFAVPLLIPLVLLGAQVAAWHAVRPRRAAVGVILLGMALNIAASMRLIRSHLYADGQRLNLEGGTALFAEGIHPAYAYLASTNDPEGAVRKLLLVGDARPFYVACPADYCVVFNRDPFVTTLQQRPANEVIYWLQEQGYSHLLVHWGEIKRLRNSRYGFPPVVNPDTFTALAAHGLRAVEQFRSRADAAPYATLYAVPVRPVD